MKKLLVFIFLFLFFFSPVDLFSQNTGQPENLFWNRIDKQFFEFNFTVADTHEVVRLINWVQLERKYIINFFYKPFNQKFKVYLFPSRASLDKQWQQDWKMPEFKSECWMVASGTGDVLYILSPRVWKEEACEHNAEDTTSLKKLIAHELTHVYHGQYNPIPTFDGLDSLSWLIEGAATFVSGQLDEKRMDDLRKQFKEGKYPESLQDFWTGINKYGQAGSLVKYIDDKYGRTVLFELFKETDEKIILSKLKTDERKLIGEWKKYVIKNGKIN